jgi:DNA-binding MarR family transcriptional regulator
MKQASGLRLDDFLPYRLSVASNTVSDVIADSYRALFGLGVPAWRLIAVLAERDGVSQLDLGVATRMDKVTVSRAAAGLADRGLVKRSPNLKDKRSTLLWLTGEGRALYAQVAPKALAFEDAILADFTPDEVAQLKAMLQRLQDSALRLAEGAA